MSLPSNDRAAEDAFVQRWMKIDDPDGLVEIVEMAMDERRPQLAARLVQLLDQQLEVEPGSAVERAIRASRLLLHERTTPADDSWSELADAVRALRRQRLRKVRRRMRDSVSGRGSDFLGLMGRSNRRKKR